MTPEGEEGHNKGFSGYCRLWVPWMGERKIPNLNYYPSPPMKPYDFKLSHEPLSYHLEPNEPGPGSSNIFQM